MTLSESDVAKIKFQCGYIRDDSTIAAYWGIPREHVSSIRATVREPRPPHWHKECYAEEPIGGTLAVSYSSAEISSKSLRDACRDLFRRFEQRHGLKHGEGQVLLLNTGIDLKRAA